jgi:hypothetical protein
MPRERSAEVTASTVALPWRTSDRVCLEPS